jgi:hypothetical protein
MVGRKDNNGWAITREMVGGDGRYGRRKITYSRGSLPRSGRGVNALSQRLGVVMSGKGAHVTHTAMVRRHGFGRGTMDRVGLGTSLRRCVAVSQRRRSEQRP